MSVNLTKLPSGLTVVTHTMPHLETAALGVWTGVGGRDEQANEHGVSHFLEHMAFKGTKTRFCIISFDTDWLYPTGESRQIVHALNAAGAAVSFVELQSPFGHDSFLLDAPEMNRVIDGFIRSVQQA
mgnify:CR=1 FL=1